MANVGVPDGTDVVGMVEPLSRSWEMIKAVFNSVLPIALKLGLTTEATNQQFVANMELDAADERYHATLWPLLVSAWKRKNDK